MFPRVVGIAVAALFLGGCYPGYYYHDFPGHTHQQGPADNACESTKNPHRHDSLTEPHWHDSAGCLRHSHVVTNSEEAKNVGNAAQKSGKDGEDWVPGAIKKIRVDEPNCELDGDRDGVLDCLDQCPGTPKNATVNEKGCWILQNLNFKTGRWDIGKDAAAVLNKVYAILEENQGLKVEVEGYTDNSGNPETNRVLSQKRAQAVVKYLVNRGIFASRLSAKGKGQSDPVADNKTSEGRAKNRRVEIKTLE